GCKRQLRLAHHRALHRQGRPPVAVRRHTGLRDRPRARHPRQLGSRASLPRADPATTLCPAARPGQRAGLMTTPAGGAGAPTAPSSGELWTAVDRYITDTLVGHDAALEAALETSAAAGLP